LWEQPIGAGHPPQQGVPVNEQCRGGTGRIAPFGDEAQHGVPQFGVGHLEVAEGSLDEFVCLLGVLSDQ
jgi:hypothetical protein